MAIDTIKSTAVLDGAIATADIANNAVTTAKVADDAVTSAKLDTNIAVAGNLAVDTDTLFVNASTDLVGINQASPSYQLTVLGATQSTVEIESASTTGESRLYMTDPDAAGVGEIGYYHNGDTMRFNTGGIERMRLSSAGLHIGGTGAANAFDDYEEGTWTATIEGSASNPNSTISNTQKYLKIGRQVTVEVKFTNVDTTGASGTIRVNGLPFASSTQVAAAGGIMLYSRFSYSTGHLSGYIPGTTIQVYNSRTGSAWTTANHAAGSGFYFWGTFIYYTDA